MEIKKKVVVTFIIFIIIIIVVIKIEMGRDKQDKQVIAAALNALNDEREKGFDEKVYSKISVNRDRTNPDQYWVRFALAVVYVGEGEGIYSDVGVLINKDGTMEQLSASIVGGEIGQKVYSEAKYFTETEASRNAFKFVDNSLKNYGNFKQYGDLSGGLSSLKDEYLTEILDQESYYVVSVTPDSMAGHDFRFKIDKKNEEILNVVVGEISQIH